MKDWKSKVGGPKGGGGRSKQAFKLGKKEKLLLQFIKCEEKTFKAGRGAGKNDCPSEKKKEKERS